MSTSTSVIDIPLNLVVENKVQLRTVNVESSEFIGLLDSIKTYGFRESISVIKRNEEETGETYYEIVNGLHRFTACKMLDFETIRCEVVDESTSSEALMCQQYVMNAQRITTKPAEYGKQIARIVRHRPELSKAALAKMLCTTPDFIAKRLKIASHIQSEAIHQAIDSGEITVAAAIALSKLPVDEQPNFVEQAITAPVDEFVSAVAERVNEIKAANQGKPAVKTFVPKPKLMKLADVLERVNASDPGIALTILGEANIADASAAFYEGMRYVAGLDTNSIAMKKAEWEAKQDELKRKADERKARKAADDKAKAEAAEASEE